MATHQIGKFKWRFSEEGFQFKFGDGEVKTLFGKKKDNDQPEYDNYQGDDSDYGYDNGYDEGYDQGYDDGYDSGDTYYDDEAGNYEDGYYDDGDQGEGDDGVYYEGEDSSRLSRVMDYVDSHPWIIYALLVILPPLGIYLLWHFGYFENKLRMIVSAASAVWFIILLILLFSLIFRGGDEVRTQGGDMQLTTFKPATIEPTEEPEADPTAAADETDLPGALPTPSATPITGGSPDGGATGDTAQSGYVYSPQTGLYYHTTEDCSRIGNSSVTLVTLQAAQNRNQSACPLCGGGTVYYATPGGSRYHTDRTCDGMLNAVEYSKEAAEKEGKVACYICAGGKKPEEDAEASSGSKYVANLKNDKSGYKVWMTNKGKAYHATANCKGMSGAKQVTLLQALQSGKPACSTCLNYLNSYVYCTSGGTYYHSASNTCGMKGGTRVTLSLALVLGKKKCPDCIDESIYSSTADTSASSGSSGEIMVYGTENGSYYHTDPNCGGMKNASRVSLKKALEIGRPACPVCCPSAEKTVYASSESKYYHSYAGCSSLKKPVSGTLAQALTYNLTACPKCWNSNGTANTDSQDSSDDGNSSYSGIFVYATENGSTYHANKSCPKADSDVTRVLLEQAMDDGKSPCQTCAGYADDKVYGVAGNKYFHKTADCSGIVGAKSGTVADALLLGLEVCPICFDDDDFRTESGDSAVSVNKYKSGASGIKVYASYSDDYYHMNTLCSRFKGDPIKVTLETALNNDKDACPSCAKSANRTVYGTTDGKYYHYSSSCAGSNATSAHLDTALAYGFKACPNCVTKSNEENVETAPKYKEGTSGIKVYAVAGKKYYHTDSTCGGMQNALYVPLEKALNYGYDPCPDCAAVGGRKVYGFAGSPYYHIESNCESGDHVTGTFDQALANGFKACPVCITGEKNNDGGEDYSAPANSEVYVDLTGSSSAFLYHSGKKCSDAGMTSGTVVTLEYAIDHGYSDCGYCNPPTEID